MLILCSFIRIWQSFVIFAKEQLQNIITGGQGALPQPHPHILVSIYFDGYFMRNYPIRIVSLPIWVNENGIEWFFWLLLIDWLICLIDLLDWFAWLIWLANWFS